MTTKKTKHESLHAALVAAQSEIGGAVKGAANPFFKSKYADLGSVIEAVKESLNKHGLALTQRLDVEFIPGGEGTTCVQLLKTELHWEGGDVLSSRVIVPENKDIQKLGAAITYLKRYALQSFMLVPSEDDDGESAVGRGGGGGPPVRKISSKFGK